MSDQTYWDATELGDDTGRAYADRLEDEREDGQVTISVVFNEGLGWHNRNRPQPALETYLEQTDLDLLAEVVEEEMGGGTKVSAWSAQDAIDPDEDAVEFSIELVLPADFADEDLHEAAWPFIATCINVTDPGTFGAPYIMNVLRKD